MDAEAKQRILSSIYPERLIFEKTAYRTPKMLNVITLLCKYNVTSKGNKKEEETEKSVSSSQVELARNGSNQFLEDFLNVKKELLDM